MMVAAGLAVSHQRNQERLADYDARFALPGYDAFVYAAMAGHPSVFTLPPWGYRVLTPAVVHALSASDVVRGFRWLTAAALWLAGVLLFTFLRRLGFGETASLAGAAFLALSPPVDLVVRHQFLVDPLGIALFVALLLAVESGGGPGLLALICVVGGLDKELFPLLLPGLFLALRSRDGTRRALWATTFVAVATLLGRLALTSWWSAPTAAAESTLPSRDSFWLGVWYILSGWREWWRPLLLFGATPLALLGALRRDARPFLGRYGYFLVLSLALPFAASVYTGSDTAVAFFVDDVPRLLIYALPLLLPLALLALDRVRPMRTAPRLRPAFPKRWDLAAAVLSLALAFSPMVWADAYRRIDLRGPRDGALAFALCDQSLAALARIERGRPVLFNLDEMGFRHRRSDPRDLRRMRWMLRDGWGPHPHYGMGPVEMQAASASVILPWPGPVDMLLFPALSAPRPTPVRVLLNGHAVGQIDDVGTRSEPLRVPGRILFRGDNRLSFEAPDATSRVRLHRIRLRPARPIEPSQGQAS